MLLACMKVDFYIVPEDLGTRTIKLGQFTRF